MELTELCKSAKEVSRQIGNLDTNTTVSYTHLTLPTN